MTSASELLFANSSSSDHGINRQKPKPEVGAVGAVGASNYITVSWRPYAKPNKYQIVANVGGVQKTIGEFIVPKSPFAGRIPVLVNAPGPFTVAGSSAAMKMPGSIALFSQASPDAIPAYDAATWGMLGTAGATVSVETATPGARA